MNYRHYEKLRNKKGYASDYIFAKKMGEEFGFTQQALNLWANGKEPTLNYQIKILKALGMIPEKELFK